jgi:hypothetical protein
MLSSTLSWSICQLWRPSAAFLQRVVVVPACRHLGRARWTRPNSSLVERVATQLGDSSVLRVPPLSVLSTSWTLKLAQRAIVLARRVLTRGLGDRPFCRRRRRLGCSRG